MLGEEQQWRLKGYPYHYQAHSCIFELLTVTTTCDFEKGGAKKLIIGSSCSK